MDFGLLLQYVPMVLLITSILLGATIGLAEGSKSVMITAMIRYMMLLSIGATGLWFFLAYALFGKGLAALMGVAWSQFQFELAVAYLGLGLAGIVGFKQSINYWLGVSIVTVVFYWGMALHHLYYLIFSANVTLANSGIAFYHDVLMPLLLVILLLQYAKHVKTK